jgi:photosystem II stability/assembly factor-like uncharacterized protein
MTTWEQVAGTDAAVYAISHTDAGDWLFGTQDGLFRLAGDALVSAGLSAVPVTAVAGTRRAWFAGAPDGIARSIDAGASWHVVSTEARGVAGISLSPLFNKYGIGFACSLEGGMFRTFDIGASWGVCNQGLPAKSAFALHVSPRFADDHTLYSVLESGVYRSTNMGTNWTKLALPDAPINSVHTIGPTIWVCFEEHGIYASADHGDTWHVSGARDGSQVLIGASADGTQALVLTAGNIALTRDGGELWKNLPAFERSTPTAIELAEDFALLGTADQGVWRLTLPA